MAELKKELARRNDVGASPIKRDQTGILSASSPMKRIRAETEISALATTCAITHTVHGKVVAANPRPVVIDWRSQRLLKYNFVLGAPDGVVEVSIIGQEATTLYSRFLSLLGKRWYGAKRWLGMGRGSS